MTMFSRRCGEAASRPGQHIRSLIFLLISRRVTQTKPERKCVKLVNFIYIKCVSNCVCVTKYLIEFE